MSDQVNVSLNGLVDEALSSLKPFQKWAVERNFRRVPANREKVIQAVEVELAKTNPSLMATMDADGFGPDTMFTTTVAGKGELLQIIIDNLPAILAAIIKILGLFSLMFMCVLLLSQSANAQYVGLGSSGSVVASSGGSTGNVGYASSGSATAKSYGSSGSAVGYAAASTGYASVGYGSSGSAAAGGYGSSGSTAAQSYGSSGSAVSKDRRPLRSILEQRPIRSRVRATLENAPVRSRVAAVASVAAAIPQSLGNAYQVALASATERARTGRKGHLMSVEAGYTTGVGYSSFNPNPTTCYGVGGNYAVVRGADGWYSTKVL